MYSEDRLWSMFRFQISPYEFCSMSHQYCCNESIDSESGVFFRCPAIQLSELGKITVMSSKVHQYCKNESIDSESGVIIGCPVK